MEDVYNIRFRYTAGDFGPYSFPKASTVLQLKERVWQEWQNPSVRDKLRGSPQPPPSAQDLRVIFGGRMLENQKQVKELHQVLGLGVPGAGGAGGKLVTMHLVVRPADDDKKAGAGAGAKARGRSGACCVIQ